MTYRPLRLGQRVRRWAFLGALASASIAFNPPTGAADEVPAPQRQQIATWLAGLNADAPRVREAAFQHLRSLTQADLEALRGEVAHDPPALTGAQDLLHDLVVQVFIANASYRFDPGRGFLGIQFDEDQSGRVSPYPGVEIRHIIVGLCASKYLREGDVVLSLNHDGDSVQLDTAEEMRSTVQKLPAGAEVTLTVIRRGRQMDVKVVLGGFPANIAFSPEGFVAERQTDAEAYWQERFEPLFAPTPATRAAAVP